MSERAKEERRRKNKVAGKFSFSGRSVCSKEHSGETRRWIVLKFGVLVQDVLGFNLAGGIVVLISGVSGIAAGQRVNKSVWPLEFFSSSCRVALVIHRIGEYPLWCIGDPRRLFLR